MKTLLARTLSRRAFLGTAAVAASLPLLGRFTVVSAEGDGPKPAEPAEPKAPSIPGAGKLKHLIIVSLPGAPSHIDLWDPKADEGVRGEFKPLDTPVKSIRFTEVLPGLAKQAEHLCVVNGMTSGEGNHDRARYLTLTGHAPNPSVKHPSLGSILAKESEKPEHELPMFVSVGGAAIDAGYLGPQYNALTVAEPDRGVENLAYRKGVTPEQERARLEKRLKLRDQVDQDFKERRSESIAADQKAMYDKAQRLMDSKKSKAFDLSSETNELRDAYGRGRFGQGMLLARRLVEEGVTCVEVRLGGWDTHQDNFERIRPLAAQLDAGMAQLIADLRKRNLFDNTAIACYGEFGRTPRINGNNGRDHYPRAWSMVLAGGPFRRGAQVGRTDETGSKVIERPVTVPDFFRSMAHACGFDPLRKFEVNDRPIWYVDKAGVVIPELFA